MSGLDFFNAVGKKLDDVLNNIFNEPEEYIYLHDQYKIAIVKLSSLLVPQGVKINEKVFDQLNEENLKRLVEVIMKRYCIEIFNYFDKVAHDLYKMFETIKHEIPDDLAGQIKDSAIKNLIMDNLRAVSVSGHGLQNKMVVKTNGKLEQFEVFFLDQSVKQSDVFKKELLFMLSDFYVNYFMTLKQQKRIIVNQITNG